MLMWLEIFAAAWLSTSRSLEGTAQEHWGRNICHRGWGTKNEEKCEGK
jgi:hypothetical protein